MLSSTLVPDLIVSPRYSCNFQQLRHYMGQQAKLCYLSHMRKNLFKTPLPTNPISFNLFALQRSTGSGETVSSEPLLLSGAMHTKILFACLLYRILVFDIFLRLIPARTNRCCFFFFCLFSTALSIISLDLHYVIL